MMGMEPTSLSRTLKAIEGKGWIVKRSDASDGRVTRILLTDERTSIAGDFERKRL